MALKFKTPPAERVLIEREPGGTQRVARAVQSDGNDRVWKLSLEHPAGTKWNDQFIGNGAEVAIALAQLMNDHEIDFMHERNRGHRPAPTVRDLNGAVNDFGADISAPITKRW